MKKTLPIRLKVQIVEDLDRILKCLHSGNEERLDTLGEEIKGHALFLDEQIQCDVLRFIETVQFQKVYDPLHLISPEVKRAADRLIEDLGFMPPKE